MQMKMIPPTEAPVEEEDFLVVDCEAMVKIAKIFFYKVNISNLFEYQLEIWRGSKNLDNKK